MMNSPASLYRRVFLWLLAVLVVTQLLHSWQVQTVGYAITATDTDSWLHMLRVQELFTHGNWYDTSIPRDNTPYGSTTHWSRLLDMLLLVPVALVQLWMPLQDALLLVGAWWNTALLLFVILPLLLHAVQQPLFHHRHVCPPASLYDARLFVLLSLLLNAYISGIYTIGQVDHHSLLGAILLAMLVTAQRLENAFYLTENSASHSTESSVDSAGDNAATLSLSSTPATSATSNYAYSLGLLAGVGVWGSVEFLLPVGVFMTWLALHWLRGGSLRALWQMSMAFAAVITLASLAEQPVTQWPTIEHDSLSGVHVAAAWLNILALTMLVRLESRLLTMAKRLLAGGVTAVLLAGMLAWMFPGFWLGAMNALEPDIRAQHLADIAEMQPLMTNIGYWASIGFLSPLLALPWLLRSGWKNPDISTPTPSYRLLVGMLLAVFSVLVLAQTRWYHYSIPLGIVALGLWLPYIGGRSPFAPRHLSAQRQPPLLASSLLPLLVMVFFASLPTSMAILGKNLQQEAPRPLRSAQCMTAMAEAIRQDYLSHIIAREQTVPSPQRVVIDPDYGAMLLFFTPHSIMASHYHRAPQAITDMYRFYHAPDAETAYPIVAARGLEWFITCKLLRDVADYPFLSALARGEYPRWLSPVNGHPWEDEGLLLLRIRHEHQESY